MFKRMIIALGVVLCLTTQCFAAWWDSTIINLQIKTVSAAFTDVQNCLLALDGTSGDPPTNIVAKNLKLNGATSGVLTIKPPATATTGTLTIDNKGTNTLTVPNANSVTLPTGALFFMITGSCPAGTTDVTATYTDRFPRVNATQGTTGGSDTVTIATANMPAHTHTFSIWGQGALADSGKISAQSTINETTATTSSTGSGTAVTITNPYFTVKSCQVD